MLYTVLLEKYSSVKREGATPFFLKSKDKHPGYAYYLRSIIKLAKEKGIEVILIKQVTNGDIKEPNFVGGQDYYVKQLEKIGLDNNLLIIDPTETFEQKGELFIDNIHLKPEGNRLLARIIGEQLLAK